MYRESIVMYVGGLMTSLGQVLMYLVATRTIHIPDDSAPIILPCITIFTFLGMILITSVAFSAPVQHFPSNRGQATSLVKSFVGMSGAMVSQLFILIWGVRITITPLFYKHTHTLKTL